MVSITTTAEQIRTGIKEVDTELGGGIPRGSLVFIEGESGTGKTVLSQYLAYGALTSKAGAVAYYVTDKSIKELITQTNSLSLRIAEFFLTDWLRIYPLSFHVGHEDAYKALRILIDHVSKLPECYNLVILDAISTFMAHVTPPATLDFFSACKELCGQSRSIVLVANPHVFMKGVLSRAYSICDFYLKLSSEYQKLDPEKAAQRTVRMLDVQKRNSMERPNRECIRFEIEAGAGIRIIPFTVARV